jgi:syntaxin 8
MDHKLLTRLSLLGDNTLQAVLERNRAKELGLNYEIHEKTVQKNLAQLKEGVKTLEGQLGAAEVSGAADTKEEEDRFIGLQTQVEKLEMLMNDNRDGSSRDQLLQGSSRSSKRSSKTVRFSDQTETNTDDFDNGQFLQLQTRIMDDQDQNLGRLSEVISRQREFGLMIGDALDTHVQLLDETEVIVERTETRLGAARKRLATVGAKAKSNKSLSVIICLIIILFVLMTVLR